MVSSNRLEPGTVGQVKATVDTINRIGPVEKYITLYSNDRTMSMLTLSLTMEVVQK